MVEESNGKIALVKEGNFPTRQSAPKVYSLYASIYVWWKDVLKKKAALYMENSKIYVMPKERSVDIDDEVDFLLVKTLMENKNGKNKLGR